jgi:hypothetical protein
MEGQANNVTMEGQANNVNMEGQAKNVTMEVQAKNVTMEGQENNVNTGYYYIFDDTCSMTFSKQLIPIKSGTTQI